MCVVHRLKACCKTNFPKNPQLRCCFGRIGGGDGRKCRSVVRGRCTQSRTADRAVTEKMRTTIDDPFGERCVRCDRREFIRLQGGRNGYCDTVGAVVVFVRVKNDFRRMTVAATRGIPFGMFRCFVGCDRAVVMTASRLRMGIFDHAPAGERSESRSGCHQQIDGRQPTGYGTLQCHRDDYDDAKIMNYRMNRKFSLLIFRRMRTFVSWNSRSIFTRSSNVIGVIRSSVPCRSGSSVPCWTDAIRWH